LELQRNPLEKKEQEGEKFNLFLFHEIFKDQQLKIFTAN